MQTQQLVKAVGLGAAGFGAVGVLAPSPLATAYGLGATADSRVVGRLFGSRNLAVGLMMATAPADEARRWARYAAAMNALDVVGALLAGRRGDLSGGKARQLALTSAAFALVSGLAARGD